MLNIFKVRGDSLYPLLKSKDIVLCYKIFKFTKLKVNDIVVFTNDNYGLMIKKIIKIQGKQYFVQGTTPMSIDSRDFGFIDIEKIKYKIFFKFNFKL